MNCGGEQRGRDGRLENLKGEPPFFVHIMLKTRGTQSYTAFLPISNIKADSEC